MPSNFDTSETENPIEISHRRAEPGVLLIKPTGQLVYLNEVARNLLGVSPNPSLKPHSGLPPEIIALWRDYKQTIGSKNPIAFITSNENCRPYLARLVCLNSAKNTRGPNIMLILIEPFSTKQRVNLAKAQEQFGLTGREFEVVKFITNGFNTGEIARRLGVRIPTVRVHLKHIFKKMKISQRSGLMAKIIEPFSLGVPPMTK
jgi:DNA-binding CsgD family transcriptional regulator